MPHIDLPDGVPGIIGPLMFRPDTAAPLMEFADVLLRGDNSLTRGERELIATYVSQRNECNFCRASHGAFAAKQLDEGQTVVDAVLSDVDTAPVSDKLKALLAIAGKVADDGRSVAAADVDRARQEGATDVEIHDTVLIAAAFCMFNRYVDGLATWTPEEPAMYDMAAEMIVANGYRNSLSNG